MSSPLREAWIRPRQVREIGRDERRERDLFEKERRSSEMSQKCCQ
jgi:hypothetical protein